ncbi:MAG: hypothetical protein Q9222_006684 [Ikaeria aurantiellina]
MVRKCGTQHSQIEVQFDSPNVLDKNRDPPLLQVLYDGYDNLEKCNSDALACLLQSHLDTEVNVMPPGTLNMPIHLAVRGRHATAVVMLIHKGSRVNDANGAGLTPLGMAARNWKSVVSEEDVKLLEVLLEGGANINKRSGTDQSTALHLAASYGCLEVVNLLLSKGADPRGRDKNSRTPADPLPGDITRSALFEEDASCVTCRQLIESRS